MNNMDGKIAFISGSARGLGAETARMMAACGAKVVIADILDDVGHATAEEIINKGGSAIYTHLDVTQEDSWQAAIKAGVDKFGGLDVLVNNAGIFFMKSTEDMTLADWHRMISVNLDGVFLGTKTALPHLKACAAKAPVGSSIINLSSIAGIIGIANFTAYHMSKGGVRIYTKACAIEFAPHRIRVNSIHPGLIETDMAKQVVTELSGVMGSDNAVRDMFVQSHPIGRLGVPADIANGIVFLASDDSAFMTGSELVVDGGWTAQ